VDGFLFLGVQGYWNHFRLNRYLSWQWIKRDFLWQSRQILDLDWPTRCLALEDGSELHSGLSSQN
jgi:hypothetical protein